VPSERLTLPHGELALSARLDWPDGDERASAVLLAHGAGFHHESPWMKAVAGGLAARGFPVLSFNYPYRERSLRAGKELPPDRSAVLEEAHAGALAFLAERAGPGRILLAGKSLGARVATHLAAKGERCAGLVLFGYPLHPPGRPERERSEHFGAIAQPALFLQGTRDEFADLALLSAALQRFGGSATLAEIDDADHGFHVPKRSGRGDEDVLADLLARVARWERATFPD
jgi:hypothetical protein